MTIPKSDLRTSVEIFTQSLITSAAGPMLAAGMSESAVIRMCENISEEYHERMLRRYDREQIETVELGKVQGFPD